MLTTTKKTSNVQGCIVGQSWSVFCKMHIRLDIRLQKNIIMDIKEVMRHMPDMKSTENHPL